MNAEQVMNTLSQPRHTRTDYFNEKTKEYLSKVQKEQGLTGKFARKLVRKTIKGTASYKKGELGKSEVAGILSRKERRAMAKAQGVPFEPVYNGDKPIYIKPIINM